MTRFVIITRCYCKENKKRFLNYLGVQGCWDEINNSADALRNRLDPKTLYPGRSTRNSKISGSLFLEKHLVCILPTEPQGLTLFAGEYIFDVDNELSFSFEVPQNISLEFEQEVAFSNTVGYAITAMDNMVIRRSDNSPIQVFFSCQNNELLLGSSETPAQFRNRLLYDERRQDALSELENKIKSPYVFDQLNNTADAVEIDGVTLPSFMALFMLNGVPRLEIAQIFCGQTIYPTLMTDPDKFIPFEATCFRERCRFGTTFMMRFYFRPLLVTPRFRRSLTKRCYHSGRIMYTLLLLKVSSTKLFQR